ncbi:hypothetical protein ACFWOG_31445 [Kitasatospora sp. NPDC058406]|uniref:hypothetical protein n=1 Tax=Kitasatospora sp. NPDC058406 TaxID=3346483 RepID=UPI00365C7BD6
MTTLDQTTADRSPTDAPARTAGERPLTAAPASPRPTVEGGATRCSIAAAGTDCAPVGGTGAGAARDGSVPRPRGGAADDDGSGAGGSGRGGPAGEGAPATRVRTGPGEGPQAAQGQVPAPDGPGVTHRRPAEADRTPPAEEYGHDRTGAGHPDVPHPDVPHPDIPHPAGTDATGTEAVTAEGVGRGASGTGTSGTDRTGAQPVGTGGVVFVRLQQPPTVEDRTVPVLRAAQEELRTAVTRRPSPSRRLRRMHPQTAGAGPARTNRARARQATDLPTAAGDAGSTGESAPPAPAAETPLGILIGGTPNLPETAGRPEERPTLRASAELVRLGRGTCLVILPAWRPAIAVSVPTEHLLAATGLAYEQLADTPLSVVINPGALHDRELELREWQAGPTGRQGRRGGRRQP